MNIGELITTFGILMGIVGVPVGILFREIIRSKDLQVAACREDCTRALAALADAYQRELADKDRQLETANVTESRLIEMALRSTAAGERVAATAEKVIGKAR